MASRVAPQGSRWRPVIAATPRHLLVPRWWETADRGGWELRDGPQNPAGWLPAAYDDQTLVTRVGTRHADHATAGDTLDDVRPTSSATHPGLVVDMLQAVDIYDGADVLDVATGSGYSAALLARSLGDAHVTSVDIDPYLVDVAAGRLEEQDLHPAMLACDATGPIPGSYDRIVSMVAVRPIPPSWLAVLRPGGRLVTVLSRTSLLIVADKVEDGTAVGRVAWEPVTFMAARTGDGYPPRLRQRLVETWELDGESCGTGRYPVVDIGRARHLATMLELTIPGVETHFIVGRDGEHVARLVHPDGSWARASGAPDALPVVHQGGPHRLWDLVDDARHRAAMDGTLPVRGAAVHIHTDGRISLMNGTWHAEIR
ncbi:methyltransferase domain-containing protein [Microtetraspora sp. NBRC 13810]|uniref:methyltransferase domain-containing protein n=1 Tax=Microtetraspora sp. NBRC 13810 TaxID=3030990 RepID=UPI0025561099|nr:methyltransferase domain-containing protein [Microtetraspora sp. NBRC 13810]